MTRHFTRGSMTGRGALRGAAAVALAAAAAVAVSAVPSTASKLSTTPIKAGQFSGKTSQGLHMALKVNSRKRTLQVVFFELKAPPCGAPEQGGLQYAGLQAKVNRIGHFKALSPGNGFYGYVEGDLHRNKASGTAVYHVASRGCNSGTVTWHATHAR
jgi:hypothetical protein